MPEMHARADRATHDLCDRSLLAFCAMWLPRRFHLDFGEAHERVAIEAQRLLSEDGVGTKLAIGLPPKHGKTSLLAYGFSLWAACVRHEERVCIVTRTADAARELFTDLVAALRPGEPLAVAYPHAAGPRSRQSVGSADGPQPRVRRRDADFQDPEGSGGRFAGDIELRSGTSISVVSRFRGVYGASREARIPSLLILDDVELWSAPGVDPWRCDDRLEYDSDQRREALGQWIDFALERRLGPGGRCLAVGSMADAHAWLANRCDLFNRDGWRKISLPDLLNPPPASDSRRMTESILRGKATYKQVIKLATTCIERPAWTAKYTLGDLAAIRQDCYASQIRETHLRGGWHDSLWGCSPPRGSAARWSHIGPGDPASPRFLRGGTHMLEHDSKTGVRVFVAQDTELLRRRWTPDNDYPIGDERAATEAQIPLRVCVLEHPSGEGSSALTMVSEHSRAITTNQDLLAWHRLVAAVIDVGWESMRDLRDPLVRDELMQRALQ